MFSIFDCVASIFNDLVARVVARFGKDSLLLYRSLGGYLHQNVAVPSWKVALF
jgi:hypothetical protein